MTMRILIPALLCLTASPAHAQEVFGGVLAQGELRPASKDVGDRGAALQLGLRSGPIGPLKFLGGPRAYVFGSVNSGGGTDFVAGGFSWRIGPGPIYVRPGIGIAVHDAPGYRVGPGGLRTDFGSRVLFEPELAIGTTILPRVTAEAAWVHLSHAQIFSRQNPGLDMIGLRVNVRLR
jgi:hypothetical protein